jgi:hypothetical protein
MRFKARGINGAGLSPKPDRQPVFRPYIGMKEGNAVRDQWASRNLSAAPISSALIVGNRVRRGSEISIAPVRRYNGEF